MKKLKVERYVKKTEYLFYKGLLFIAEATLEQAEQNRESQEVIDKLNHIVKEIVDL